MQYEGLKILLYFAYGSLLKGVCSDYGKEYAEKVRLYLEGDSSLKNEIIAEIYKQLPHAMSGLKMLANARKNNLFDLENVEEYIFKIHSREVMSNCAVKEGIIKKINPGKKIMEVLSDGKIHQIQYLSSLEKTFQIGSKVYFHYSWLICKR